MTILIRKLSPHAKLPERQTEGAAGFDLYSCIPDGQHILPVRGRVLVGTGVVIAIPPGYVGQIWSRSGWSVKHGIGTLAGVIDADYRGELMACLMNHGEHPLPIQHHERVAQLVIVPCLQWKLQDVTDFPALMDNTVRGAGGFGSTGGTPDVKKPKEASEGDRFIGKTLEEIHPPIDQALRECSSRQEAEDELRRRGLRWEHLEYNAESGTYVYRPR